jgi:hypothetical protein
MGSDINESKLVGGKRKNGHKSNCTCHICENMKNKAKHGGYEKDVEKEQEKMMGGSKKKNGHRKDCKCPICKNMRNFKKRGGGKSKITKKRRGGYNDNETDTDTDTDTDTSDEEEQGEEQEQDVENIDEDKEGGRRKKKRSNGHKLNCKCPICKNMRKEKKGGDDSDIENQILDIKEVGVKGTKTGNDEPAESETTASAFDYDIFDAAEKGEAGQNVVGGTRKRRRSGKKWGSKTRKYRRSHRRH